MPIADVNGQQLYYEVIGDGWERALVSLKALLEK